MNESLKTNLNIHFQTIYKDTLNQNEILELINKVLKLYNKDEYNALDPVWSQSDIFLITYGDTLKQDNQKHLNTLSKFLDKYTKPYFNNLHILPFFPFSSDDGFSITDYEKIRPDLGSWEDMKSLSNNFRLMSDVVTIRIKMVTTM